ncbi:MAG: hypothetical protein ACI4LP_03155 [Anaerovoracaceae bacterium]
MGFYEITQTNLEKEKILLLETQHELNNLPKGTLQRRVRQGRSEYYTRIDGTQTYIPKNQYNLVNNLKRRRVLETAESIAKGNIKAMERLLKEYEPINFDEIERNLPQAYRGLEPVTPEFAPGEKIYFGREGQHFTQSENPYMREKLVNSTYFGLKTRSKSEAILAETIYRSGFSVYYEKKIILYDEFGNKKIAYLDFVIPLTPYYEIGLEHNGLLDDDAYFQRNMEKLRLYHMNGIYQPKNLIITADKPGGGLDNEYIECLVQNYLTGLAEMVSEAGLTFKFRTDCENTNKKNNKW